MIMTPLILITAPAIQPDEAALLNELFAAGCERVHLRKPDEPVENIVRLIKGVDPRYRKRLAIHGHVELVAEYGLGGLHLPERIWKGITEVPKLPAGCSLSASCHSLADIKAFPFSADYLFLSPVFDSLSKPGYTATFDEEKLREELPKIATPVYALGGITPRTLLKCKTLGFSGAAVLGYVWQEVEQAVLRWRELSMPQILCIGGLDPSGGAGITADVRTAMQLGVRACPVATAVTYQDERHYAGTRWMTDEEIRLQLESIAGTARPSVVKIGLVESYWSLRKIMDLVQELFPGVRIVWDPIIRSSTGCCFHSDFALLPEILASVDVVTPNLPEAERLFNGHTSPEQLVGEAARYRMAIILKGGHTEGDNVTDMLIMPHDVVPYTVLRAGWEKHGTGCAHSTAVASWLARGADIYTAAGKAQLYVSRMMRSALGLLDASSLYVGIKPSLSAVKRMFITHASPGAPSLLEQVEAACRMGVQCVQLRMKRASDREMLETAFRAVEICRRYGVLFIVNDRVQIARQSDADGVHLGQTDMSTGEARALFGADKIIGRTCNTREQVCEAIADGADYLGVGPYRYTATKENLSTVLGLEGYRKLMNTMIAENLRIPVFAIGGITDADESLLMDAGVQGVAVSGDMIRRMKSFI